MGHDVVGADPRRGRVARLNAGARRSSNPAWTSCWARAWPRAGCRFIDRHAAAVRERRYVFVMFDTPVDENDQSDLRGIFRTFEAIAPALARRRHSGDCAGTGRHLRPPGRGPAQGCAERRRR